MRAAGACGDTYSKVDNSQQGRGNSVLAPTAGNTTDSLAFADVVWHFCRAGIRLETAA